MTRMKLPNSPEGAAFGLNGVASLMSNAASSPMRMTQTLTQEGLRFWARRMHAYADWADAAARSATPEQFLAAQNAFFTRAQEDYAQESAAVAEVIASAASPAAEKSA